jgi:hypothetical protein
LRRADRRCGERVRPGEGDDNGYVGCLRQARSNRREEGREQPAKTDGDKKIWYVVDGDKCQTAVLGTDGALTETGVDKAECGL